MKLFKTKFIFAMLLITILFAVPTFSKNTLKNDEYGFCLKMIKGIILLILGCGWK